MYKKSIIVTGGTDGIGLALVKKLIEKDQYVFIIGRNPEKGNAILNDIKSKNLEYFQCDLSELNQINELLKKLKNLKKSMF